MSSLNVKHKGSAFSWLVYGSTPHPGGGRPLCFYPRDIFVDLFYVYVKVPLTVPLNMNVFILLQFYMCHMITDTVTLNVLMCAAVSLSVHLRFVVRLFVSHLFFFSMQKPKAALRLVKGVFSPLFL